jgi:hypothetical protein
MVANACSTRSPISRHGPLERQADSKRFPRRERAGCRAKLRRAGDIPAHLRRSNAATIFTIVFLAAPLAPVSPNAAPAETKRTNAAEGLCLADAPYKPLEHDRRRCHQRSALHEFTLRPVIAGRVDADQSLIQLEIEPQIRGGWDQIPPGFSQSGHSRDALIHRLTRKGIIQMSVDSTTMSRVRRFITPHARS